ncbi:bifunctional adenosylcobinamide kinase/adenosylcobinamide-phosphate guanylyltransferase [Dysgonomonas sp. HDW5A]|uniref:bifunctional adenosylcobinamide kinase/adenosylcobinamide-phosphate guanylyltransferase n=1 Tax=unclassified Dysgonomonas TaxID=2630389 RepID=UPI001409DAB3|nr:MULTISPECIES: bifunctional adenosylcobinamide kinase/adenosylcobinamide-phosphate guanylyltransferase [unclassified Dysgonomonas]QIK54772.1 bifunctional adenosylcobinamide kinase/adenosylcobinamide-phosphate guanylyltransferase [Dysgonomonas sp. HDW5B]QIK60193.1 bifunctional adenosylcobinamide kinase/adenosylcobinamide-phosphate guanylyltransferase [Dysgonomonas sp. HDW5A]
MAKEIIFITGGQRSGKSSYAQQIALSLSENPVYLATSRIWDEEHQKRIERHKADRGTEWTNIEEEKQLSNHRLENRVVLVDCVTLWATNFFFDNNSDVDLSLAMIKEEFDKLIQQEAQFIFVSNEIGLGGTSENKAQRLFMDLQGWINQYIASKANKVYLMVSGIPLQVK